MKISRTIVNETKRNIYVLVGIWIIAGVEEPSLFGNLSWTLHYNYVIVHFIHNNCPYFFCYMVHQTTRWQYWLHY